MSDDDVPMHRCPICGGCGWLTEDPDADEELFQAKLRETLATDAYEQERGKRERAEATIADLREEIRRLNALRADAQNALRSALTNRSQG
jgi:hypothetical protein